MAAAEATPALEADRASAAEDAPQGVHHSHFQATVDFLQALALPKGACVAVQVFSRTKYGAERSTTLDLRLLEHKSPERSAQVMHASDIAFGGDSSVVYCTPTPRDQAAASKAMMKRAIDDPNILATFLPRLASLVRSPDFGVKAQRVADIDIDLHDAVPLVLGLVGALGLPCLGLVRTQGGAHVLYRPGAYTHSAQHRQLVAGLASIDAAFATAAADNDVERVTSLKMDRMCPVPGTVQNGVRVQWVPCADMGEGAAGGEAVAPHLAAALEAAPTPTQ